MHEANVELTVHKLVDVGNPSCGCDLLLLPMTSELPLAVGLLHERGIDGRLRVSLLGIFPPLQD